MIQFLCDGKAVEVISNKRKHGLYQAMLISDNKAINIPLLLDKDQMDQAMEMLYRLPKNHKDFEYLKLIITGAIRTAIRGGMH